MLLGQPCAMVWRKASLKLTLRRNSHQIDKVEGRSYLSNGISGPCFAGCPDGEYQHRQFPDI
jgi:hypothetical protein